MITEVKMQVTPELSERAQEIVFNSGGEWQYIENKELHFKDKSYLFIDENKSLSYTNDKIIFEANEVKEVSAYDFIVSQGEQEWLPKYGEEALFMNFGEKKWTKELFKGYLPSTTYPFFTLLSGGYKYCKPILKQISFVQFLKDNTMYEKYINNTEIENQRWHSINEYITLDDIKRFKSENWITKAFNWKLQSEGFMYWNNVHNKWQDILKSNEVVWDDIK